MPFTFVSGDIALDFAGTIGRRRTDRTENLDAPGAFADWAVAAGLLDECRPPTTAEFARAIDLREAIYRAAPPGSRLDGADRALINTWASGNPPLAQLAGDGSVDRVGTPNDALAAVARAAVELIGGPDRARVKECGADQCTRLYLDLSRAMSRRWCDMTLCGNRAKGAAFRARSSH